VIMGIVYGINANRGAWGPTPPSANGSFPKKHPDGYLPGDSAISQGRPGFQPEDVETDSFLS